jgi:hypothetical protein
VRQGAAYEVFDDCRADLAAWAAFLRGRGLERVALLGHSSGALKCLSAAAKEPGIAPACVIAVSPPRLAHSVFLASEHAAEFRETYERASALTSVGEGGALLDVRLPLPFLVTAARSRDAGRARRGLGRRATRRVMSGPTSAATTGRRASRRRRRGEPAGFRGASCR